MDQKKLEDLISMADPQEVFEEVRRIISSMYPWFDLTAVRQAFQDVVRLFRGDYPGYQKCNTRYHDLKHTTDCLLAMTRLVHGAFLNGRGLPERNLALGLIAALMHDTGYIQTVDDREGTGAKYTLVHIERSIGFMKGYFASQGFSSQDFSFCRCCLKCTGLEMRIAEIQFDSPQHELLGRMLGTADLLGQMADRTYLERLPFLYWEFKEAQIPGYESELDLLTKTPAFWEFTKERLATELGKVDRYLPAHFRVWWGLDRDLYRETIERNLDYLQFILKNHPHEYRRYLHRGGLMRMLSEMGKQP